MPYFLNIINNLVENLGRIKHVKRKGQWACEIKLICADPGM
jgi:hypothetical protein